MYLLKEDIKEDTFDISKEHRKIAMDTIDVKNINGHVPTKIPHFSWKRICSFGN